MELGEWGRVCEGGKRCERGGRKCKGVAMNEMKVLAISYETAKIPTKLLESRESKLRKMSSPCREREHPRARFVNTPIIFLHLSCFISRQLSRVTG